MKTPADILSFIKRDKYTVSSPEEHKKMLFFCAAFMLFACASAFSITNYIWLNRISGSLPIVNDGPTAEEHDIKARADVLNNKFGAYMEFRKNSEQLVSLAEAVGRYPVAMLPLPVATELSVPEMAPPSVTVKAIVVMDRTGVATLDIEGEPPGQIMRQGSVFGGGKGKITGIDEGGVSWTWTKKKYRTEL